MINKYTQNTFGERFVQKLGKFIERVKIPNTVRTEAELELAVLTTLKAFVQRVFPRWKRKTPILYHHGTTTEEKRWWSRSKALQRVQLFGTNVSDMFIVHQRTGAIAIEFKYVKETRGSVRLTSQIQRAVGQSIIATLRHPFGICAIVYQKPKKSLPEGKLKALKRALWEKHRIYLVVRPQ